MKQLVEHKYGLSLACLLMGLLMGACSDDKEDGGEEVVLNPKMTVDNFYPVEGSGFETVTLRGSNFGTAPEDIKVYFNHKEAELVRFSSDSLIVKVPRLPGDECKVGVVKSGSTDTVYYSDKFIYHKGNRLEYVCGNVGSTNGKFEPGRLTNVCFGRSMQWLACDKDGYIYMNESNIGNGGSIDLINLKDGYTRWLSSGDEPYRGGSAIAPWYDSVTKRIYVCAAHRGYFWQIDPAAEWKAENLQLVEPDEEHIAKGYRACSLESLQWCYSYARSSDGFIYCRDYSGHLFRFKLEDRVVDLVTEVCPKSPVDAYICGDPEDMTKIYCSLKQKNIITRIDLSKDPSDAGFETVVCGQENNGGFADGAVQEALLKEPSQILVTRNPVTGHKVIYICDSNNRCVREYDMDSQQMTTLAGISGSWGYSTGLATESLLSWPMGICQNPDGDLYVSDSGNRTIMKIVFQ